MKKSIFLCLASLVSFNAFALNDQSQTENSTLQTENQDSKLSGNLMEPSAPWDKIECRAIDTWGRVFTASGHNWRHSRATELQNEAVDTCSRNSSLYDCRPMGCWYY